MANLTTTTQFANRYGLNLKIYDFADASLSTALMDIDFVNVSNIDISGDRTWATGGQAHSNKIGFNDPVQGTVTLSTQILTMELLNLMAGGTAGSGTTTVVFENTPNAMPKYYILTAETVWQDAAGNTYAENLTFHKVSPQRAFNIEYNGEGDPVSVDVVFDLLEDANGKVLTITKTDN